MNDITFCPLSCTPCPQASKIPVELCLTSNICTETFSCYTQHHFATLFSARHPVVLCTDDSGVFNTTLSNEYAIAMRTFALTEEDVRGLVLGSVDHTFGTAAEKQRVRVRVARQLESLRAACAP